MIAVKWRTDLEFPWPEKTHSGISTLPEGFDDLIEQSSLDQTILDNQAAFDQWKIDQADLSIQLSETQKFKSMRDSWQKIADELAVENAALGITAAGKSKEVADSFRDVVFYLNANTPTEALVALNSITPIPVFLTAEKISELNAAFIAILAELWPS